MDLITIHPEPGGLIKVRIRKSVFLHFQMGDSPKRVQSIAIDLEVPKDVPEEKKEAIRRIAQHCPVHQTLHVPPQIGLDII